MISSSGMRDFKALTDGYLFDLKDRAKKSRVYKPYQLLGLNLAELLEDNTHKSLYIKLAKDYPPEKLLGLAKRISENKDIKNKGAYFMSALFKNENTNHQR